MGKKTKNTIAKYEDVSGQFSNKTLFQSFWFVSHKLLLRNIVIGVLMLWCLISVGYSVFVFGDYVLFGYWEDRTMYRQQAQEFPDFTKNKTVYEAQNIVILPTQIFAESSERYSVYTRIKNPNDNFIGEVYFHYNIQDVETPTARAVIMPGSDQFLAERGILSGSRLRSARLVVERIDWKRVDPHTVKDVPGFVGDRLGFVVEDFTVSPPDSNADIPTAQVEITMSNDSVYSFRRPDFFVVLYRGRGVEYVHYTTQPDFLFGQKRVLRFATLLPLSSITDIEVVPVINVFDPEEYLSIDYQG